jgi:hypothetical protein
LAFKARKGPSVPESWCWKEVAACSIVLYIIYNYLHLAVNTLHFALCSIHFVPSTFDIDTPRSNLIPGLPSILLHNGIYIERVLVQARKMPSTSRESDKKVSDTSPPPEFEKTHDTNATINPTNADDSTIAILELVKAQDAHHPMHWPAWKRWSIITLYCFLQLFVTMTSTSYRM